jgi:hypothetical protein
MQRANVGDRPTAVGAADARSGVDRRIPRERTALPEVLRADEAYAGPAEQAPTGNGRKDPGLRGECWTTVSRTAREYRA